jgi:uncharacterized phosphosugar-binding protein
MKSAPQYKKVLLLEGTNSTALVPKALLSAVKLLVVDLTIRGNDVLFRISPSRRRTVHIAVD